MKETYFISGLPRSGSTLLSDLLAQNPDFYCSPTSGVRDMCELVKNNWNGNEHFKASFDIDGVNEMIKGIFHGYYSVYEEPVIFDKNRGWTGAIGLANLISHEKEAKIRCTVRDLTDIIASLEKMNRRHSHNFMLPQEKANQQQSRILDGRCEGWVSADGIIGGPYSGLLEAFKIGKANQLLLVEYDELCLKPEETLKKIYKFIDKPFYKDHYYEGVKRSSHEYEMSRGFPDDLHEVRPKVEFKKSDAINVLGKELFDKYSNSEFWRQK